MMFFFSLTGLSQEIRQFNTGNWNGVPPLDENWIYVERTINHKKIITLPKDGEPVLVFVKMSSHSWDFDKYQFQIAKYVSRENRFVYRDKDFMEIKEPIAWLKLTAPDF